MAHKKYYHKKWTIQEHKKFPFTDHEYLFMRTNQYELLFHNFDGKNSRSRMKLISKISGSTLEHISYYPFNYYHIHYFPRLLKTKNRNREI